MPSSKRKRETTVFEDPVHVAADWAPFLEYPILGKCALCKQPAVSIILAKVEDDERLPIDYPEPGLTELMEELRERFHTNFEMPVCESHQFGSFPS